MLKKHPFLPTFLFLFIFGCRLGMLQAEVLPVYDTLGGDFEMDSTLGKTVSLKDFEGKLLLIYFGYTSCPDVCPTTLTVIKQAVHKLDPKNELIQVLFISVDPERDSLEKMKTYLEFFNPGFVGLHAPFEEVQQVAKKFGSFFMKDEVNKSAIGYLVTHTGYVYLMDRKARIRTMFSSKVDTPEMIETVNLLLKP
jgi:protein SCO1/2